MTWEAFARPRGRSYPDRVPGPTITVTPPPHRTIALNIDARHTIGNPAHVVLLYDAALGLLGVRAATLDEEPDAYRMGAGGQVSIGRLLTHYRLAHPTPGRRACGVIPAGLGPAIVTLQIGTP